MKTRDLQFLLIYAEVYGLKNQPVTEVIELAIDYLNSDEMMYSFIESYHLMKDYHLEAEVKACIANGDTFLSACREWDILCVPCDNEEYFDFESYDKAMEEVNEDLACKEYELENMAYDMMDDPRDLEEWMWYKHEDYMNHYSFSITDSLIIKIKQL